MKTNEEIRFEFLRKERDFLILGYNYLDILPMYQPEFYERGIVPRRIMPYFSLHQEMRSIPLSDDFFRQEERMYSRQYLFDEQKNENQRRNPFDIRWEWETENQRDSERWYSPYETERQYQQEMRRKEEKKEEKKKQKQSKGPKIPKVQREEKKQKSIKSQKNVQKQLEIPLPQIPLSMSSLQKEEEKKKENEQANGFSSEHIIQKREVEKIHEEKKSEIDSDETLSDDNEEIRLLRERLELEKALQQEFEEQEQKHQRKTRRGRRGSKIIDDSEEEYVVKTSNTFVKSRVKTRRSRQTTHND